MNSSVKPETRSNSLMPGHDSDDDSFVVLDRELMHTQSIDNCLSLVSMQLEETESLLASNINTPAPVANLDDIQTKVVTLLDENKRLKETLEQNHMAIKHQMEIICSWQLEMQKVQQNHKEKFAETKVYIDGLKKENMALKEKLKQQQQSVKLEINAAQEMGAQNSKQPNEIDELRKEYETLTEKELQVAQKKVSELETTLKMIQLTNPHEVLVNSLKQQLAESKAEIEKLKETMEMQKAEFATKEEQFWRDIEQLKKRQAESTKNENIQELLRNLRLQLMQAQENITQLTCDKKNIESALTNQTVEFKELQQQYNDAMQEIEYIPILKMQLDVYKNDFDAEKEAVRSLKVEKEKIAEDLNLVQHRNEQLLREIEQLRATLNIVPNAPPTTASASSSFHHLEPKQQSPPSFSYSCPICMRKFNSHKLVTDHVEYCLANQ